jgi:hypothetical protein
MGGPAPDEVNDILAAPTRTGWAAHMAAAGAAELGEDRWQTR